MDARTEPDIEQERQSKELIGWVHFCAGRLDDAELVFRELREQDPDPTALAFVLAWEAKLEARALIDVTLETDPSSTIALARSEMAAALNETVFGSDAEADARLGCAADVLMSGHHADEQWMLHLTNLGMAAARGAWGNASASSDRLVRELERLSIQPHLVRIGRSTKWERLTGPVGYLVSGQPDAAANWLRVLKNLYVTRLDRNR